MEEQGSFPVGGDSLQLRERIYEVLDVFFSDVVDSKVVDGEREQWGGYRA